MKYTIDMCREDCTNLWSWLALNPHKEKYDWPGWEYTFFFLIFGSRPDDDCVCCEYANIMGMYSGRFRSCGSCPLPEEACHGDDSWFDKWDEAKNCLDRITSANEMVLCAMRIGNGHDR